MNQWDKQWEIPHSDLNFQCTMVLLRELSEIEDALLLCGTNKDDTFCKTRHRPYIIAC